MLNYIQGFLFGSSSIVAASSFGFEHSNETLVYWGAYMYREYTVHNHDIVQGSNKATVLVGACLLYRTHHAK